MPSSSGISGSSFRALTAVTVLGMSGYALLLPVVPLWVARGGAGELGAGVTTGVLMLTTVAAQLGVPWLLMRWGHRWVLGAGLVLLGAPTPLLALSADLAPVLAVSAVRGVGFGFLTVAGGALVAELVPPVQHGKAAARYGIAAGAPQLVLLAAGVALADGVGFPAVFVAAGVAPLLAALLVPLIGKVRPPSPELPTASLALGGPSWRTGSGPVIAMVTCSVAQGGLITFLPLAAGGPALTGALFATVAGTMVGRLVGGYLVDRRGLCGRLLGPGMLLSAAGMGVEVLAGSTALLIVGAAAVGLGFGLVQNDAMTTLFRAWGTARYGSASAAWNIAYDAGTGVGAVGLGAVAEPFGLGAAFGASALLLLLAVAPVVRSRPPVLAS